MYNIGEKLSRFGGISTLMIGLVYLAGWSGVLVCVLGLAIELIGFGLEEFGV